MNKMYKLILPARYFYKRRITILAVAAIALCVFIVVIVMTVMNGLVIEFKKKNHKFAGDCVINTDSLVGFAYYEEFLAELEKQDFVHAASPVVKSYGLLTQPGAAYNIGIEIMGIEPRTFSRATGFAQTLYYHRDNPEKTFVPDYNPQMPGCVVGIDMIDNARDRSGEYYHSPSPPRYELIISCFPLTAKGALASVGTDMVNTKTFWFSDDSHSGLVKIDGKMIYVPFDYAQKLCGMTSPKRASAIHIKFEDTVGIEQGREKVAQMWHDFTRTGDNRKHANLFANVKVQSWTEYRRATIAPMEKEQTMLTMLFLMLGIITVFIIFVVFYMIISHKRKDIGILKSVGVTSPAVMQIFTTYAILIGLAGAVIGTAAACGFLVKLNNIEDWVFSRFGWELFNKEVYAIGYLPNSIEWKVLTVVVFSAILASLIGAFLPSMYAVRRRPVEILQVDQL